MHFEIYDHDYTWRCASAANLASLYISLQLLSNALFSSLVTLHKLLKIIPDALLIMHYKNILSYIVHYKNKLSKSGSM